MANSKRVLFLCVGNSCRSQMAEGLLRNLDPEKFDVHSAGSMASGVNAYGVKVMAEIGIDISSHRSKAVDEYAGQRFDYVMTVCDESQHGPCPVFVGEAGRRFHWPFDDPAYATGSEADVLGVFRRVRDEIRARLVRFLKEEETVEK